MVMKEHTLGSLSLTPDFLVNVWKFHIFRIWACLWFVALHMQLDAMIR